MPFPRTVMRTLLATLLLTAAATAQFVATSPNPVSPANLDRPFPGGIGRYQQWYAASEFLADFQTPVRIEQLEFFAGSSNSAIATTIDMEVSMAHANPLGLTGTFSSNFASPPVVVWSRGNVQLQAGAPGALVMTIPFQQRFTWDRTRPIVIDIKIFGNGRNNQPFTYNLRGTTSGFGVASRSYAGGNASATTGAVQANLGLVTRFRARPGVLVDFGFGCQGEGGFVPRNIPANLPSPGVVWNHQLTNAASQRWCFLMVGLSNTMTSTQPPVALPIDLGTFAGLPPSGCSLLVDPVALVGMMTVGGGAGAGVATFGLQLPPTSWYVGVSFYTQWLVADPLTSNGLVAASQGVWAIVAPLGG
jgi:hypothetical protein